MVFLLMTTGVQAQIITYPVPRQLYYARHNDDYTVKVRQTGEKEWIDLYEYNVKVDADTRSDASMVQFDFTGEVEVLIQKNNGEVRQVDIRPLSKGIRPAVDGNCVLFTLDKPQKLSIEFNGDRLHNLHLFANAIRTDIPDKNAPGVMYFEAGYHEPTDTVAKNFPIPSNTTVYLEGGAVLKGPLVCERVENVKILGTGMLHETSNGITINYSKNVLVDGITVVNPRYNTTTVGQSENITIKNVKSFSYQGWGDLQKEDAWKGRSWRSGQVIWCGFDHGSIAGSQLGKMGIIDYFRIPKRAWYWYRNEYQQVPSPQWPTEGMPAKIKIDVSERQEVRADGTDDVILYVTILDATGKEISNSPSVTLKLISGPGEFPTGTSITFDENSDIRILDGKAAIEFRSYYAGTAVIEATSSGLELSRVSISFNEAPAYKEETTLPVKERPYNRFVRVKVNEDIRTFGRNNPTFSSSSSIGYPAGAAADGDKKTQWQADANDWNAYWTLDTEKGLALREINIVFPSAKAYQYKIEASADNLHWTTLSDKMDNREVVETERFLLKDDRKFRFVRIAFGQNSADMPAAISEVIVKGIILE